MNDLKSKLPDLKEIASIGSKLFGDLKKSIGEIVTDYKKKRETPTEKKPTAKKKASPKSRKTPE